MPPWLVARGVPPRTPPLRPCKLHGLLTETMHLVAYDTVDLTHVPTIVSIVSGVA